jgi:uncharacterized repeat protein (TIGR03803 family)
LGIAARRASAQTETVLYSFGSQGADGADPLGALTSDKDGNLYGMTSVGGAYGLGTVFEFTSAGTEKLLYNFGSQTNDGSNPEAAPIFDDAGNLYGTTANGGAHNEGTVFELTKKGKEKILYSFGSQGNDGQTPVAGLIFDKKGNLYSTTYQGGAYGYGTVFELTKKGAEKILHSFGSQGDGINPNGFLVFDAKGNLYSTTAEGGDHGGGTVFKLTASGAEKILYSFGSQTGDGETPLAGLTFDNKGNLYSTTDNGGAYGYGTVFEFTAKGIEKVLYSFGAQSGDGEAPRAAVILDKKGNLYTTTDSGGAYDYGTVFELTKKGTEKILYNFGSQTGDGNYPNAFLIFDKKGNLYSTTYEGGAYDYGTIFKVVP